MGLTPERRQNNWGRWSDHDEIGALNLITPERVVAAASLVALGRVVSLGRVLRHDTPRLLDRPAPVHILTTDGGDYAAGARDIDPGSRFSDDFISMPLGSGTHIDALAHAWSPAGLYNGHDPNLVRSRGAKVCGIDKVSGIVTGGVLADVCRLHSVDALPPSHLITSQELEKATKNQIQPGDALLIRTGWLTTENVAGRDPSAVEGEAPGIGVDAANWIVDHDISVVGADTLGVEVFPPEEPGRRAPIHITLIVNFGVHLIELLDLEELAPLEPQRFLFVAAPLRIRGGVNSPLNPLAVL